MQSGEQAVNFHHFNVFAARVVELISPQLKLENFIANSSKRPSDNFLIAEIPKKSD